MDVIIPSRVKDDSNNFDEELIQALLRRGDITPAECELVQRQSRATGIHVCQLVLDLNLISEATLQNFVAEFRQQNEPRQEAEPKDIHPSPLPPAPEFSGTATPKPTPARNPFVRSTPKQEESTSEVFPEEIFRQAISRKSTDVHFDPQEDGTLRVRFRIDGTLREFSTIPRELSQGLIARIKVLAQMDIIEKRDSQDGHIKISGSSNQQCNLRIATIPTKSGERLVARILDEQSLLLGMDHLGLSEAQEDILNRMLSRPHGIVAVTGPVGSGKTTTLYSCLQKLNSVSRNLMTIEDPVEYRLKGVNQSQVETKIDWTFPKALRAILRQDPDVIMVGEIRDEETAHIAVRASLTGVFVLSSMHANDSASALGMFYNYGIPSYLTSTSLIGIVAQRLVRVINRSLAEEFSPDESMRDLLGLDEASEIKLLRAGESKTQESSYLGRTGIYEIMEVDNELRDLIFSQASQQQLRLTAMKNGMMPLAKHGFEKVRMGITTMEEIYRVAMFDDFSDSFVCPGRE